jgi:hypothetical protein
VVDGLLSAKTEQLLDIENIIRLKNKKKSEERDVDAKHNVYACGKYFGRK